MARIAALMIMGGSVANRARLTLEVTEAVTKVWGAARVGIRFSPGGVFNDMHDSNPLETFSYMLHELNRFHLAYAHVIVSTEDDLRHRAVSVPLAALRQAFHGPLIVANGFNLETATRIVTESLADAVAFGRLFLANPDLPERFRLNAPLNSPDESDLLWRSGKGLHGLSGASSPTGSRIGEPRPWPGTRSNCWRKDAFARKSRKC